MRGPEIFDLLASLVDYPAGDFRARWRRCAEVLSEESPEAAGPARAFLEYTEGQNDAGMEELYTRTFDMNPSCALEAGWHLYGENYARGTFLVSMREAMRRFGLEESAELPDHLRHLLALAGRMPEGEARRLVEKFILPALEKILKGLPAREGNPYAKALEAVRLALGERFAPGRVKGAA
jgi:nitrate reductase delta subunit